MPRELACALLLACVAGASVASAAPIAEVNPTDLLFGTICAGDVRDLPLQLYNTGTTDLLVSSASPLPGSDPNFIILPDPRIPTTIHPGAQVGYTIRFIGFGTPGFKASVFRFAVDDATRPTIDLVADGTVGAPVISVAPCPIGFAATCPDRVPRSAGVTICNFGTCPLHLTGASVAGPDFALTGAPAMSPGAPIALQPGACIGASLTLTPTSRGAKSDTLSVGSDDPSGTKSCAVAAPNGTHCTR